MEPFMLTPEFEGKKFDAEIVNLSYWNMRMYQVSFEDEELKKIFGSSRIITQDRTGQLNTATRPETNDYLFWEVIFKALEIYEKNESF